MKHSIILFFILFVGLQAFGQTEDYQLKKEDRSIIYLKGGSELEVLIIDWDKDKGITATTRWGQEMFFPNDRIEKVKSYSDDLHYDPYRFRNRGLYYSLNAGLITSNHGERFNEENGYTFSFSSGYRFHRLLSVGLGTGIDQYASGFGERIHPVFVEFKSFLMKSNTSFVVNVQTGYGFAFENEVHNIVDARGGLLFYPSLGLSFGNTTTKFSFDIGYKFQNADWTYASPWDARNQTEYRMNYQRLVMRFGIVL